MIRFGLFILLLAACIPVVPATEPPQLQDTPGAYIVITGEQFDAGSFVVTYPPGWRVVKASIAAEPVRVVFISPDDALIFTFSEAPLQGDGVLTQQLEDGTVVHARIESPAERLHEAGEIFRLMLESLMSDNS